jgi:hypothetical protein
LHWSAITAFVIALEIWNRAEPEAGHESEKSTWRENIDILNFHFLPTFCTFCFENCWEI